MQKRKTHPKSEKIKTSWESVGKWYHSAVGEEGHYYHKKVILPGILKILDSEESESPLSILDLACGQGILARHLPEDVTYLGIDASSTLIKEAKRMDKNPNHSYLGGDITKPLPIAKGHSFSHATIILALQNIEFPHLVFKHLAPHLISNGKLILVLNHPCFRIPRQSSWQVDAEKKIQYRRIDCYSSPLKIPIKAHPSQSDKSPHTLSFHYPLSSYSQWLFDSGFVIENLLEWHSDKVSEGGAAKMENRSRAEIPLFLTIVAKSVA